MSERFPDEVLLKAFDKAEVAAGHGNRIRLDPQRIDAAIIAAMRAVLEGHLAAQASGLQAGHEFKLSDGRVVRVMLARDYVSVCRDSRGRVAVRNVLTHRLSYMQESDLQRAARKAGATGARNE